MQHTKPEIVIWGAGGHGAVVAEIIRLRGEFEAVGFLDDTNPTRRGELFYGLPILGGEDALDSTPARYCGIAVGNTPARIEIARRVRARGLELPSLIHPRAVIADDVSIGDGTIIKAGAMIDPLVTIGELAIVGAGVTLGHGCAIRDGARLSGGAHLAGWVQVGRGAWIGVGAAIKDRITIGEGAIIGAGAVVVEDVPAGMLAYGVPARVKRAVTVQDQ